jgi:hypothetical protein
MYCGGRSRRALLSHQCAASRICKMDFISSNIDDMNDETLDGAP